jgi:3-hydroxyacyl-CoA dehydrogenase
MTMTHVSYEMVGTTAVIRLDNPPVNGLSHGVRAGIVSQVGRAEADDAVRSIVIAGSSDGFSAGADVREFGTPAVSAEPTLPAVITMLESARKPVIAAIKGNCLGGGLELALGCHYRVASSDAKLGLPEVKIGLLPGAGGTQRLPRAVGVETALNMIVSGEPVPATSFLGTQLMHEIVAGDLVEGAVAFAERVHVESAPLDRLRDKTVSHPKRDAFFLFARGAVGAMSKNYPAPLRCVDAVEAAVTKPFDEGMAVERKLFAELYAGP